MLLTTRIARIAAALTALCAASLYPVVALADVRPGDQVMVQVYGHPELSVSATVDAEGDLTLPLAGRINVSGLDTRAASDRIRAALAVYVRYAAVDVRLIAEGSSIFLSGGPGGVLKYEPGATLTSVLAALPAPDGIDEETGPADLHHVDILRGTRQLGPFDATALEAAGSPGPALMPGDTLILTDKPVAVGVRGDVKSPGVAHLDKGEPLRDAIAQRGGPLPTAASGNIELIRDGSTTKITLADATFATPAQPGDVVVVPVAPRVTVTGSVTSPGETTLRTDFTLVSAIYGAGGPKADGDLGRVTVIHGATRTQYDVTAIARGNASQNPTLADGDIVAVAQGRKRVDAGQVFQAILLGLWTLH